MENTNQILDVLQGDASNMNKIESQLFSVVDYVPTPPIINEIQMDEPQTQIVYRQDTGKFLGHVGMQYKSLQPTDFYDSIVRNVQECGINGLDLSKMKFNTRKDSKIIEFRIPTNVVTFKNRTGGKEEVELFMNLETGFGGNAKTSIGLYSLRLICTNGMKVVHSEMDLGFKHTENMNSKAIIFCDELIKTVSKVAETKKVWQELDAIDVSNNAIEAFTHHLLKIKDIDLASTKKKNQLEKLMESIELEMNRTGKSAYGLLQGATHFTNHNSKTNADEEYILNGTGAKVNQDAQQLILANLDSYRNR